MQEFKLFHLKFRELNRLERSIKSLNPKTPEEHLKVKELEDVVIAYDCLLNVSDLRKKQPDYERIWRDKVEAAKALLSSDGYTHIATIKAKNLPTLIKLTSNGLSPWYDRPKKNVTIEDAPWRETFSYDVVQFSDQTFMYMSTGWLNLNSGQFSSDML